MTTNLFHIQWHMTNLCHLRCRHCYQEDFSSGRDLGWPELKAICENVLAASRSWNRALSLDLTGGEPLLKPELLSLLDYLSRAPEVEELGIITNGLLITGDLLERLNEVPKLRRIKISLDGPSAEVNDSIRQEGSFEKITGSLSLLAKQGRFQALVMVTLMKRNYRSLPHFIQLCQDLGVDGLILERFIPLGRGQSIREEVLGRDDWKKLTAMLLECFSPEVSSEDLFRYQAFQILFGEEMELLGAPCVVGKDGLCIMPDGDVFPCRRFPLSIGNLLKNPLESIWGESELLYQLRRKEYLKGKCGQCELKDCRGCRSLALALTGDYLEEDPHCWHDPPGSPD